MRSQGSPRAPVRLGLSRADFRLPIWLPPSLQPCSVWLLLQPPLSGGEPSAGQQRLRPAGLCRESAPEGARVAKQSGGDRGRPGEREAGLHQQLRDTTGVTSSLWCHQNPPCSACRGQQSRGEAGKAQTHAGGAPWQGPKPLSHTMPPARLVESPGARHHLPHPCLPESLARTFQALAAPQRHCCQQTV